MLLLLWWACAAPGDTARTDTEWVTAVAEAGDDVLVEVGSEATFDGSASSGQTFTWDFGDGGEASGESATHTYAEPGHYEAVLTVTGEDGTRRRDAVRVTVYLPAADTPPTSSGTIAVDDGGVVWAVTPEAGVVSRIVDGVTTELTVCGDPSAVALDGDTVGIACPDAETVVWLDADGAELERATLPTGSRPVALVGRDGSWWVALAGTGELWSWPAEETIAVGDDLRGLAWGPEALWVSRFRSAQDGGSLFRVAAGEVEAIALPLDTAGDSDTTTGGVPNLLAQVSLSPDGGTAYLPGLHANVLRGEYVSGEALTFETALRAVVLAVDTEARTEAVSDRKQLDERGYSVALAPSSHGDLLYVLHPGVAAITVLSAYTFDIRGSILGVGEGASGLVVQDDMLYVHAWLDRQVHAYDISDLSTSPVPSWSATTVASEPLEAEVLLGKQLFYRSGDERLAKSGYIACAHCHPEGDHDGLTWDFTDRGEGLRNTTSLLGRAGTAMGPVHWSGNFDEIQDFENDIRNHFAGTGLLDDADWAETADPLGESKAGRSEDLDALAAYVSSLQRTPASPFVDDTDSDELFETHCASCHPAPLYTDSSLDTFVRHDIGTLTEASGLRLGEPLDGLDTPTLLGSWATGPWLHDGSAATLEQAIEAHDLELSADELAGLTSLVSSL